MKDPVFATFVSLSRSYRKIKVLSDGRRVHAQIAKHGYDRNTFLGNCLVEMYGNCGSVEDAGSVFNKLSAHDLYSWNILITAYGQNGYLDDAQSILGRMPFPNVVSWNAAISAFAQNGRAKEALGLFRDMQREGIEPNRITLVSTLDACAELAALEEGREIHSFIDKQRHTIDIVVGTALVNMYGKCGAAFEARDVFVKMPHRDVVSWTAMIAAFAQNGHGEDALYLFYQMQREDFKPDEVCFICALEACASLAVLEKGQEVHTAIVKVGYQGNLVLGNALVNMYGKCGSLCNARSVFDRMPDRDVVSWTAVIAALTQNDHCKDALDHFCQMEVEGIKPNKITFLCALDACSSLSAIEQGQEVHANITDMGYGGDAAMGNALINMYGKCGSLDNARMVFDKMPNQNAVSWTAMIAVYAQNGHGKEALDLFNQMEVKGFKPNALTFICALNACSHTGQVDDGRRFFVSMNRDYGLTYTEDHYVCMVDLLGRAGHLDEAEDLIACIPLGKARVAWLCLLSACRLHKDVERAARAASQCFELNPKAATPYVTLANIYAAAGRWDDAANVREALMNSDVIRQPDRTFIEVNKVLHEFGVTDMEHFQIELIHLELHRLTKQMGDEGY